MGVEREVEHVEILAHARRAHRLGDDDQAVLQMPAQDHLGDGAAVLLRQRREQRIAEQRALAERAPRLDRDAAGGAFRAQRRLLERRVALDLVDRGNDSGLGDQPVEMVGIEVGDADRARAALLAQPDQRAPGLDIEAARRDRPMDQIEIDMVEPEPIEAGGAGGERRVEALVAVPDLGGDIDLLAATLARSPAPTPASLR